MNTRENCKCPLLKIKYIADSFDQMVRRDECTLQKIGRRLMELFHADDAPRGASPGKSSPPQPTLSRLLLMATRPHESSDAVG